MSVRELNPNHGTTQRARELWPKFCAILMHKMGEKDVEITIDDIKALGDETFIVIDERGGRLVLRLVNKQKAQQLAAEEGGLPL